jgi:hypothetical protein
MTTKTTIHFQAELMRHPTIEDAVVLCYIYGGSRKEDFIKLINAANDEKQVEVIMSFSEEQS